MPRIRKILTLPIGTKFTYNGVQYEVVKYTNTASYCIGCDLISLCIYRKIRCLCGYCDKRDRADNTNVIFKKVKDMKVTTINPLFNDDNTLRNINIKCPKGFIIDKENSDFNKGIIKFKRDDITISDIYTSISLDNFSVNVVLNSSKTFPKIFAIAKLMDIASYYNGNWDFNHANNDWGYYIKYVYPNNTYEVDNTIICNLGVPYFKNEEDAQAVIDNPNFRDILDTIFK